MEDDMGLKFSIIEPENAARIKVIGVGGCGNNALNTMIEEGIAGVEFIACNTDKQVLAANLAGVKVQLGAGLGAGGDPSVGQREAEKSIDRLREAMQEAEMVFITAGMGGGTGTGAAPIVAKTARELGALTVAVVTKPFMYEGRRRMRIAEEGIKALREQVDTIIVIPNQKLLAVAGADTSLMDAFRKANEILLKGVRSIADLVVQQGHVNLDFADVKSVMKATEACGELALMGAGQASGDKRAVEAAAEAISCPLMENVTIDGARGVLINITGGFDLKLSEVNEAAQLIMKSCAEDAAIFWGQVIDPNMKDGVRVTVIATGFDEAREHYNAAANTMVVERQRETPLNRPAPPRPTEDNKVRPIDPVLQRRPEAGATERRGPSVNVSQRQRPERQLWKNPSLLADEDVYDVPAFLRKRKPD
jgi:cell division protein FtsZ